MSVEQIVRTDLYSSSQKVLKTASKMCTYLILDVALQYKASVVKIIYFYLCTVYDWHLLLFWYCLLKIYS